MKVGNEQRELQKGRRFVRLSVRLLFLGVAVLALAVVLAGLVYGRFVPPEVSQYQRVGLLIDIGGRTLNMHCSGDGKPTVIFETASHQAGMAWIAVQSQIAGFTRACWYDRAGYGWSEPGPPPRTLVAGANDLQKLLSTARVPSPYVLVGMGDVTLLVRVYHALYPSEVAGAVFIDGNDVDVAFHHLDAPDFVQGPLQRYFGRLQPYALAAICRGVLPVTSALKALGWRLPKLGRYRRTPAFGLTPGQQAVVDVLSDRSAGEPCQAEDDETAVRAANDLGDLPLIVLASRQQQRLPSQDASAVRMWNEWWVREAQAKLAAWSTDGRLTVVDDRVGMDSVVGSVREIVDKVRH